MPDYTPPTWTTGQQLTAAQVTAMAAELDETETALASRVERIVWNGTAWPNIPADSTPREFVGGTTAPADADLKNGDTWIFDA